MPNDALDKWIQDNAQWFGLEAEYVDVTYDAVDEMLRQTGPALLQIRGDGESEFLVLLGGGNSVSVLAPDLSTKKVSPSWVRSRLVGPAQLFRLPFEFRFEPLLPLGVSSVPKCLVIFHLVFDHGVKDHCDLVGGCHGGTFGAQLGFHSAQVVAKWGRAVMEGKGGQAE